MVAPASRMDPADDVEGAAKASPLWGKYGERVDAQSARELLAGRLEAAKEEDDEPSLQAPMEHVPAPRKRSKARRAPAPSGGGADAIGDFLRSREGKALQRGIFGMLRKRL
jgi:uncharacterized protein